ncbi:MAG: hypothetical protein NTV51_19375, partial [Verrucomicrobia bacterium]|nr:hypothetical protein [Verrucomicrobiota bacterium]
MPLFQKNRLIFALAALVTVPVLPAATQPAGGASMALDDLKPGQRGEVWTVFRGTEPEPFAVEVTGVIRNALGPGKSLIICELTDERVQKMGAVAGMSGSPLYVDGKLAGALSYQIQRFETVRYAGFTPAADLAEVREKVLPSSSALPTPPSSAPPGTTTNEPRLSAQPTSVNSSGATPLQPAFTFTGLSPAVAELFAPRLAALGLSATALGGSTQSASLNTQSATSTPPPPLRPGGAVSVAVATGDITLAGTGTVSRLDGDRVTAFGHPMLSLGEVALPMCAAEIVTILPSSMSSVKIANTGAVIGTISQDRLSAVSGTLGPGPAMTDVEVTVAPLGSAPRTLRFSVARQAQLTPAIVAAGVTQAIMGANDAGLANGFRLRGNITFPAAQTLATSVLYAGPQGFAQGLNEFIQGLAANLQNPYEKTFPDRVVFTVEPLAENPLVVIEQFQLSRASARAGDTVQVTLSWRDFQGASHREIINLAIDAAWAGKRLEVVLAPGRALDEFTGRPRMISASELRSFGAYIAAIGDDRPNDGLCLAAVHQAYRSAGRDITSGLP